MCGAGVVSWPWMCGIVAVDVWYCGSGCAGLAWDYGSGSLGRVGSWPWMYGIITVDMWYCGRGCVLHLIYNKSICTYSIGILERA
ncbi:hypothetical protein FKM82_011470 [Ascaphus truei]